MIVDCAHYRDGARQHEGPLDLDQAAKLCKGGDEFVWLGLHEPTDEEIERVGEIFGLRSARYDDAEEEVEFGEIHIFLGSGYAIVVRHGAASDLRGARRRLEERPELLAARPGAVPRAVVDKV